MTRFLRYFNLLGVVVLTALCVMQWSANRRANLEAVELAKIRLDQAAKLIEQEKTIKGYAADLEDFRARLASAQVTLNAADAHRQATATSLAGVTANRDRLKSELEKRNAAIATINTQLKNANDQIQKLAEERNATIARFNELAGKYNAAENDLKKAGEIIKNLAADRNAAAAKFNGLAEKYNAIVKELNEARAKQ